MCDSRFFFFCRVACNRLLSWQEQKQRILDKYGGSEHLEVPDARLLVGQTESYVEYDRTGRVVKGAPKVNWRVFSGVFLVCCIVVAGGCPRF